MPKYAAKVDANQPEIVQAFRAMGCSVSHTHTAGEGFPDLAVGFKGAHGPVTVLVEVKDGSKPLSGKQLTGAQKIWHREFQGAKAIVESVEQVAELVNSYRRGSRAKGRTTLNLPVGTGGS